MQKRFLLVCATALLLSACASTPGEFVGGAGDTNYGGDSLETTSPKPRKDGPAKQDPARGATTGAIAITVTSPSGAPIPGAIIAFSGASKGTMTTNAKGMASKANAKPGVYTADLKLCGALVRILGGGGGADFTVVQGKTSAFSIGNIGWEPRYQPIQDVSASPSPPWKNGTTFAIAVVVNDLCTSARAKTPADLRSWVFVPSGVIAFAKKPVMASDAKGTLRASFKCTGVGEGDIVLQDPRDGRRFVHIVGGLSGTTAFSDTCID